MYRVSPRTLIITVFITCLFLGGCGINQKQTGINIKEYNDAVADYNRLATGFTRLARLVEENYQNEHETEKVFKYKFENAKQNVLKYADEMNKNLKAGKEMYEVYDKIRLLIYKIKEYIIMLETNNIPRHDLLDNHRALYDEMVKLSSDIVSEFESLYEQIIGK
jgi:hypothetical protein